MHNILLAGVGGQGTVLASKILAQCAIARGEIAHTAETIGMAQRGGCVVSHVRIGANAYSPLIPAHCADVIIGFEPGEAVRVLPYLKPNGTVIVNSVPIKPITDSLSDTNYNGNDMLNYLKSLPLHLIVVDGQKVISECKSSKVLNIALLGAAARSGVTGCQVDEIETVIRKTLKPQFCEMNLKALSIGASIAEAIYTK